MMISSSSRRAHTKVVGRLVAVVALANATIVIAFGVADASGVGLSAVSPTPAGRIAWSDCGRELQCARVRVPLDWSRPHGPKLVLAVIRHLASRPARRIGSLFINPGGPGGSGVGAVRGGGAALDAELDGRFDVVSWDLRGSASSTHVRCFASERDRSRFWGGLPVPETRREALRFLSKTAGFARGCRAMSGELLAHISESDSARDLDYLRQLVGDSRLTFIGASAGTFLGQTYANMFPGRVRAMVLDGVVNPIAWTADTGSALANLRSDSDLVFERFLSTCQTAGRLRCALAGHGPVASRVRALLARLKRGSIPAPSAARPRRLVYGDALVAITFALDQPAGWPKLARELDQAAGGDGSALASAGRADEAEIRSSSFEGTQGILCADAPAAASKNAWGAVIAHLTEVSRISGSVYGWNLWAPCASWGVRATGRYTGPWNAHTSHPILVVGTRFDPSTPFANARFVSRLLGNAVLLTHLGYGHLTSADPSRCVRRALATYIVDLVPPAPGTVCASDRQPFDPDFGKPLR
jgi:pimeloyl-ACP methyl ester carboxylesterase